MAFRFLDLIPEPLRDIITYFFICRGKHNWSNRGKTVPFLVERRCTRCKVKYSDYLLP